MFRGAINCVAYYGITRGTGDGSSYSPDQDVTRAQMAVFIARAAEVAGVDLGSVGDAGFDDIDGTWAEAQDAINRLALKGMIPSGGTDPARWILSKRVAGQDPEVQTLVSDGTGAAVFSVGLAARPAGTSGDVTVTYTLAAADNAPSVTVDADGRGAASGTVIFSDGAPSIAGTDAIVTVDTPRRL